MSAADPTTFVLLHGAGLGAWCWERVTPLLRLPALAVDLPGRGMTPCDLRTATRATYVRAVVDAIAGAGVGRCILVAHSFTGGIAHLVAAALPRQVIQIVFLAAVVPAPGRSVLDMFPPWDGSQLRAALTLGTAGVTIPHWVWRVAMRTTFTELDPATLRLAYERLVMPEAAGMFLEPLDRGAWPTIPCSYIKLLRDRCPLTPARQDMVIRGLPGAMVATLDTGHTAMLSAPHELAGLLNAIAEQMA